MIETPARHYIDGEWLGEGGALFPDRAFKEGRLQLDQGVS